MRKIAPVFISLTLLFSCSNPVPKPKIGARDTLIVAFKPKKGMKGPVQLYVGAYEVVRKLTVDTNSLKGSYDIGYKWTVKISDTTPDGKGHQILDTAKHPIPLWQPVPDSLVAYLTPLTTGN
jgi:hypothetical protein